MKTLTCAMFVAATAVFLAGCTQEAAQKAASTAEETAKKAEGAAAELGEKAQAAAAKVGEKAEQAVAAAGEQAEAAMAALGAEFSAASKQAAEAVKGVEGGGDLLAKVQELFTSATTTLTGVTNEETARAAVPRLEGLALNADGLKPLLEKLPEGARTAVAGLIEKGLPQLEALVKKALAIPGLEGVIKPAIDDLMGKLAALTGKPA